MKIVGSGSSSGSGSGSGSGSTVGRPRMKDNPINNPDRGISYKL